MDENLTPVLVIGKYDPCGFSVCVGIVRVCCRIMVILIVIKIRADGDVFLTVKLVIQALYRILARNRGNIVTDNYKVVALCFRSEKVVGVALVADTEYRI